VPPVYAQGQVFAHRSQPYPEGDLSKFAAYCGGIAELVAASDVDGTLLFDDSDAFGGGIATGQAAHTIEVPCARVDTLLAKHKLEGPYLLKLDTHGFEIPILQGAMQCLAQAQGVIIEVYNHYLTDTSELFYETCQRMDALGFRPAYLGDVTERPHDDTFWQMDILFVPKSNPMFAHKAFR
jgi:Methyltransferase FkbM domain